MSLLFIKVTSRVPLFSPLTLTPPIRQCRHVFHGIQHQVPPSLLLRYKHQANQTTWSGLQKLDILNHVPAFSRQEHNMYQTMCPHPTNHLQHHSTKGQHDNLYGSITPPFNSQVPAIFFPFATTPAAPHYPVFTDRHSPQYGMLTFLLHVMTNTLFSTFLPLSPPPSASTLLPNHTAGPISCTLPSLNAHTNLSDHTPIFPQPFT